MGGEPVPQGAAAHPSLHAFRMMAAPSGDRQRRQWGLWRRLPPDGPPPGAPPGRGGEGSWRWRRHQRPPGAAAPQRVDTHAEVAVHAGALPKVLCLAPTGMETTQRTSFVMEAWRRGPGSVVCTVSTLFPACGRRAAVYAVGQPTQEDKLHGFKKHKVPKSERINYTSI